MLAEYLYSDIFINILINMNDGSHYIGPLDKKSRALMNNGVKNKKFLYLVGRSRSLKESYYVNLFVFQHT